jgi:glycerate 2-kinase
MAPASPPADPAAIGWPLASKENESGPRLDTTTRSDRPTAATLSPRHRRKALAAPDSFKGTASAFDVASAIERGALVAGWDCDVCPLSDGGDGFAQIMASVSPGATGEWVETEVTGPLGTPVPAKWWIANRHAVVESASACGLVLAGGRAANDPMGATSRGVGELVLAAVAKGATQVVVGLGGSASTDGGRGAVDALMEAGGIGGVELIVACDVATPFVEAAQRFGPQKGASHHQVGCLVDRLESLALEYRRRFGVQVASVLGSGAAGGLAGGLLVMGAELVDGFDLVSRAVALDGRAEACDLVITGEGCLDQSSWSGKVVGRVVEVADRKGIGVLLLVGELPRGDHLAGSSRAARAMADSAETSDRTVVVKSLTERFGRERSYEDPAGCLTDLVAEVLQGSS